MTRRVCIIGLDQPQFDVLKPRIDAPVIAHETLPRFVVRAGQLFVDNDSGAFQLPVAKVVFHGVFADDFDLFVGLSLWGGPCFPSAQGMLDCRHKHACLARCLRYSRFAGLPRGFVVPGAGFSAEQQCVAKWGNWHCGENKTRFQGEWTAANASVVEPFIDGEAVRVVVIGERTWQIRLAGESWLKSIHHPDADFIPIDAELAADTRALGQHFGLQILANDYIIDREGNPARIEPRPQRHTLPGTLGGIRGRSGTLGESS